MEKSFATLEALQEEAREFVRALKPIPEGATIVTFSGELGAGKTAFIKAAANALGVEEVVTSPTFVLEKIYQLGASEAFKRLVHIDAYRLEEGSTLSELGFVELMKDKDNLIMLEWPERVAPTIFVPTFRLTIKVVNGAERTLTYG